MLTEKNTIVYDVEIQNHVKDVEGGWGNPGAMGMSSAVTYDFATDTYDFFLGDKGKAKLLKRLHNRTVVGFNSVRFDSRVLMGNTRQVKYESDMIQTIAANTKDNRVAGIPISWENIDLALLYVSSRFEVDISIAYKLMSDLNIHDGTWNLDALCKVNLGKSKNGEGILAPYLWESGEFDKLLSYNLNDVRLTRDLFLHILDTGMVKDMAGRSYQVL